MSKSVCNWSIWLLVGAASILMLLCLSDLLIGRTAPVVDQTPARIVVEKGAHRLSLFKSGQPVRTYDVALGRGGIAEKRQEGDNLVPEGRYHIVLRNPASAYHLSLRLSYPTAAQQEAARRNGVDPGGDIMIHGIRNGLGWIGSLHRSLDWTRGCIGMTNDEIEEIWRLTPDGSIVDIRP